MLLDTTTPRNTPPSCANPIPVELARPLPTIMFPEIITSLTVDPAEFGQKLMQRGGNAPVDTSVGSTLMMFPVIDKLTDCAVAVCVDMLIIPSLAPPPDTPYR